MMNKDVMIVTGPGQIGMAIARRVGFGKKIILGDKRIENANAIAEIMNNAGYDRSTNTAKSSLLSYVEENAKELWDASMKLSELR